MKNKEVRPRECERDAFHCVDFFFSPLYFVFFELAECLNIFFRESFRV